MDITANYSISLQRLKDFLDSAGRGSAYWCDSPLQNSIGVKGVLSREGIVIYDIETCPRVRYRVNIVTIQKGLQIMAEKEPLEFFKIVTGEYNNATGDTFMQYALFGDIIYG